MYSDFSKVSDTVLPGKLLIKQKMGISTRIRRRLRNWLKQEQEWIVLKGGASQKLGVGADICNVFINDLASEWVSES